VKHT